MTLLKEDRDMLEVWPSAEVTERKSSIWTGLLTFICMNQGKLTSRAVQGMESSSPQRGDERTHSVNQDGLRVAYASRKG